MSLNLLVVDDEADILDFLVEEFSESYSVSSASNGANAWDEIERSTPDLVLLDVAMPGMDGLELCKKLRATEKTKEIPVLFVSAKRELETVLSAFAAGADDYIQKPFRLEELKARVAARLRRKTAAPVGAPEGIVHGNLAIRPRAMTVEVGGKQVSFSSLEFRLLKFFAENPDRVVKREEILRSVWDGEAISARTIDAHLVSVRRRIARANHEIASMYGEGYIFRAKRRAVRRT